DGDGHADLAIGAMHADPHGSSSGSVYVILGQTGLPNAVDLGALPASGVASFEIHGIQSGDHAGSCVAGARDINGDGLDDLLIGAQEANRGGMSDVGEAYLVYGSATPPALLELSALGTAGVVFRGLVGGDRLGLSAAGLGDVNGDGQSDLIIGSDGANPGGSNNAGAAYLVFGSASLPALITGTDYSTLGRHYTGIAAGDQSGTCVAGLGDVDGDGGQDFGITAICASPGGRTLAGQAFVFFGESLLAPNGFSCTSNGTEITLDWDNPQGYDQIEILRDDVVIATLSGGESSYLDSGAPAGLHHYTIRGSLDGHTSLGVTCSISIIVLPPTDFACASDEKAGLLSWSDGQTYTSIEVRRDGVLIATLPGTAVSYLDPGLSPGSYLYCLTGFSGTDGSTETCCVLDVPLPIVTLDCSVDGEAVTLEWTAGQVYDEILIRRDGQIIVTLLGEATTFTDLGVTPGSHEYSVSGVTGGGTATGVHCVVDVVPPVGDLVCTAEGDTVSLSWTTPITYDSISVWRNETLVATLPGTETGYVDAGLAAGGYEYVVLGEFGAASSEPVGCSIEVLIPIIAFVCSADDADVFLSWTNGQIYAAVELRRDGVLLVTLPGSSHSYLDAGVAYGSHTYELTAVDGPSVTSPVSCAIDVLAPPSDAACSAAGGMVTLTWTNGAAYDQIEILRNGALLAFLPGTATSFIDTVIPGSYLYSIVGTGPSAVSAAATCEVIDPGAPFGLSCSAIDGAATVAWTNGAPYDTVEVSLDGTLLETLPGGAVGTTIPDLATGVHTICVAGTIGGDVSSPACCQLLVPVDLTDITCTALGGNVQISWTNGEIYESITILRDGVAIATVPGFVDAYSDTGAGIGVHTYEVTASLGGGTTAPVSCTIQVLAPFSDFECVGSGSSVSLAWTAGELYDSITVFRNGFAIATLAGAATSYEDVGLPPGYYAYQIRGEVGSFSQTLTIDCSVLVPLAPFGLNCSLSGGDVVSLNWSNSQVGDSIIVLRNGVELTSLPGTASTFTDTGVRPGIYEYCLVNVLD
ncbi:MAG: FG-GAP repeat protein, partial [Planctomycetes bacterium]|nr:FG-GAP repeat protein [Planctomycetota bacterium]